MERVRTYEEFKELIEYMYKFNEIRLPKKVKSIVFGEILRMYDYMLYAKSKSFTDDEWKSEADARCREMSAYLLALSDVGKITKDAYNRVFNIINSIYYC